MKEQIVRLIGTYQRRIETCRRMILENDNSKDYNKRLEQRLVTKRGCFRQTVSELERILESTKNLP